MPEQARRDSRLDDRVEPGAVEAHAVDDRPIFFQTKQPRLGIARLRARRHGADLDKAEAEAAHRVGHTGVLVIAGGEPHRVREVETPEALRQNRRIGLLRRTVAEKPTRAEFERPQGQLMRGFGRQPA